MYKYYFDEDNCTLYKSGCEGCFEEYIYQGLWNAVCVELSTVDLVELNEEDADDLIKEMEGDEYKLVDGCVLIEDD